MTTKHSQWHHEKELENTAEREALLQQTTFERYCAIEEKRCKGEKMESRWLEELLASCPYVDSAATTTKLDDQLELTTAIIKLKSTKVRTLGVHRDHRCVHVRK